ncbi:interferon regulatory factor 9-like [Babylonia areolata]|uniref:interferon regulatory factor 9-like n=1 Tax=Babylonia areolata TaxID=304850 RepID=UPI003FD1F8FC
MFYPEDCCMDPGSPDGGSGSSRARQRLKPWLEAQINSGRFPGLAWVDRNKGIFRITWKHGGRADWSEQDALIFREWAIHTGRYREGTDNPDWPSWKTRLRCALNKLPDIQELKDRSCYDEPNPYRVYKFVDRRGSSSPPPPPPPPRQSVGEDSCGFHAPPPLYQPPQRPSVIQSNIPTTVSDSLDPNASAQRQEACGDAQVSSLGSDLEQVSITDLLPMNTDTTISLTNISVDSNIHTPMDTDSLKGGAYQQLNQHIKPEPRDKVDPVYYHNPVGDHEFTLTLRYRCDVIEQKCVTNPHGCRVYYGDITKYVAMWDPQLFGDSRADQILVPYQPGQLESRQDQLTFTLLDALELGINIYMHKGGIYVLRRCKTTVFTAPPNRPEKQTIKVERRNEPVKVFDFNHDFLPAYLKYRQGQGPRPSPHVIVAIGQNYHNDLDPYVNLLLSLTITHPHASHLMAQHVPESSTVEISRSNEYDRYFTYMQTAHGSSATLPLTPSPPVYPANNTQ